MHVARRGSRRWHGCRGERRCTRAGGDTSGGVSGAASAIDEDLHGIPWQPSAEDVPLIAETPVGQGLRVIPVPVRRAGPELTLYGDLVLGVDREVAGSLELRGLELLVRRAAVDIRVHQRVGSRLVGEVVHIDSHLALLALLVVM